MVILRFLMVGLAAGWIMGKIRRGHGYGWIGNLFIGAIGSLIGWFLAGFFHVEAPNILAQIALAVTGAVLFFLVVGLFRGKKRKKSREDDDK